MAFSLIWNTSIKAVDGKVLIDFNISPNVRREPEKFPGLPDLLEITVFRKEATDFKYNKMRNEFFETEDISKAELVFSGKPERKSENMFRWTDNCVKNNKVYTYWLTTDMNDRPLSPIAARVVDNNVIWTHDKTMTEAKRIAKTYKNVEYINYGHSVKGREMFALKKGNMDRAVVIIGGVHAAEAGQFTALDIMEKFLIEKDEEFFEKVGIAIMPSANPDEAERMAKGHTSYLRVNSAGVDLNRNFPSDWNVISDMYGLSTADPESATYRGPRPASEPETRAIIKFIESLKPISVFSLHCYPGGITYDQFFGPGAGKDDEFYVEKCRELAVHYSLKFRKGEYPDELFLAFGTTPGSLPVWIYRNYHVPAFDMEAWDYFVRNHESALKACEFGADIELMEEVTQRHYDGMENYLSSYIKTKGS